MTTFFLILHLIITLLLVGSILLQPSDADGITSGMGGSNTLGGVMTARGTANLLTRTTSVLVALFFLSSLLLAIIHRGGTDATSILDAQDTVPIVVVPSTNDQEKNVPGENVQQKEDKQQPVETK